MGIITLRRTCFACPEQYDAYLDGEKVGYLRLRHGSFTVHFCGPSGELIYEAQPLGDGAFEDDERDYYLRWAVKSIHDALSGIFPDNTKPPAPDVEYKVECYD